MPFLSLILLALMIVTLIDVITRDESQVRYLPRLVWILLVVLVPLVGAIIWWAVGREYPEGGVRLGRERSSRPRKAPRTQAPSAPPVPPRPVDTRTTEQQIADLDREIEEWRLREELAKRKKADEDPQAEPSSEA